LILPEAAAAAAWRRWRGELDIDAMSYGCLQLLPVVAASLPRWLAGDASAARFQGIVKMVWSRNQVRLHKAAELHGALLRASVAPVLLIGPIAWSLLTREEGAIRSIPNITLMIPRRHVADAISALGRDGWELCSELPGSEALDWSCHVPMTKGDETLHLHWRLFRASEREMIGCEWAFLERHRTMVWNRYEFQVPSAETDLMHRLTDRPAWDPVPWQADVLMTSFASVDWPRFRKLVVRFSPLLEPVDVLRRLMELRRDWRLPIPEIAPPGQRLSSLAQLFALGRLPWKS
jgi:hypothetical protein